MPVDRATLRQHIADTIAKARCVHESGPPCNLPWEAGPHPECAAAVVEQRIADLEAENADLRCQLEQFGVDAP